MRNLILLLIACLLGPTVFGQTTEVDSMRQAIQQHPQEDKTRLKMLIDLSDYSVVLTTDELEKIANEMLALSRKLNDAPAEGIALLRLCTVKGRKGDKAQETLLMQRADSITKATNDAGLTVRMLMRKAYLKLREADNQQALKLYEQASETAVNAGDKKMASMSQTQMGLTYRFINDYPKTIEWLLKAVRSAEGSNCQTCLSTGWEMLGSTYTLLRDQEKALSFYQKALSAAQRLKNDYQLASLNISIGEQYRLMGKYPDAIRHYNAVFPLTQDPTGIVLAESNLADVYTRIDSLSLATKLAFSSLEKVRQVGDKPLEAWINGILARIHLKKKQPDSALYYSQQGMDTATKIGSIEYMRDNAEAMANAFAEKKDFANAYRYHLLYINYRDSMLNSEITKKTAVLQYNYDLEKKEAQITTLALRQKVQRTYLISAIVVLLLILVLTAVLYRNNRSKQRANQLLQEQKLALQEQRDQINKTLSDLQRTQAQLIQSEKMASLGELTAGIAHEIQNPLNFVNNFSEVSRELVQELKQEVNNGDTASASELADDVLSNLDKVVHHGRRADSIVKNMLQHARRRTGEKQSTDINAMVDEYLRLSYQGQRVKNKDFNATIKTSFDEAAGGVNIVLQDVGRVLLNLFNNAFYALNEKQQQLHSAFDPVVSVRTKREGGKVVISVKDNGVGMPEQVANKAFQPFFTTKPTGEGTGLGLSLAYDIVKAHGGTLSVQSKEGEGSEFIVTLPTS